jgi:hypothetical protein
MVSKRKKVAVRKTARKVNNNTYFILAGIAAAAVGVYFLAGDQIAALFRPRRKTESNPTITGRWWCKGTSCGTWFKY